MGGYPHWAAMGVVQLELSTGHKEGVVTKPVRAHTKVQTSI